MFVFAKKSETRNNGFSADERFEMRQGVRDSKLWTRAVLRDAVGQCSCQLGVPCWLKFSWEMSTGRKIRKFWENQGEDMGIKRYDS